MAKIVTLKDNIAQESVYPQTVFEAIDAQGQSLDVRIKAEEQAVSDEIQPTEFNKHARYTTTLGMQDSDDYRCAIRLVSPGDTVSVYGKVPSNTYVIAFFNNGTFVSGIPGTGNQSMAITTVPNDVDSVIISLDNTVVSTAKPLITSTFLKEKVSTRGMIEKVGVAGYNLLPYLCRGLIISTDGSWIIGAMPFQRGTIVLPTDGATWMNITGAVITRTAFYSSRPNGGTGNVVSVVENYTLHTTSGNIIPVGATWMALDLQLASLGSEIHINGDFESLSQKIVDINEKLDGINYANRLLPLVLASDGNFSPTNGLRKLFIVNIEGATTVECVGASLARGGWFSTKPNLTNNTGFISVFGESSGATEWSYTVPVNAKWMAVDCYNDRTEDTITIQTDANSEGGGITPISSTTLPWGDMKNNSFGEQLFAAGERSTLRIMCFGNSFMRNSCWYLSSIAAGCGINLTVGNLYTGGTNLADHLAAMRNESAIYGYAKMVNGATITNSWNNTPQSGLLDERWDIVVLHQYLPWDKPYEPHLSLLVEEICNCLGYCPKFYINATWAGSVDGGETYYGFNTEMDMLSAVWTLAQKASESSKIINIIPTGTAIQNARTLSYADDYVRFVNAAPDLHHLNPAGGFIAACTFFEKIVTPLTGKHCSETTFRVQSPTYLPPSEVYQPGIVVRDDNYLSMCQAAIDAVANPYNITDYSE